MNERHADRIAAAVVLASAFASAGAAGELLVVAFRRFVLGRLVVAGWESVWMTPVSWLLVLLPVGVAVGLADPLLPAASKDRLRIVFPALVTAFGLLFLFHPLLHPVAVTILAFGVAFALARALTPRSDALLRVARRVAAATAIATCAAALVVHGGRAVSEARSRASLPAAPPGSPNVLLLVLDTVRASSLGLHGHARATSPSIDALGRRGVVFERAHSTAPWTLPSHASLFTGRYPHELSASWDTPLDATHPTLAEVLSARGYDTAGFVANVAYCSREMGLDRGFAHYEDVPVSLGTLLTASSPGRVVVNNPTLRNLVGFHDIPGRKTARGLHDAFLAWLGTGRDRPYFAFLNYYDAHEPYLPPAPWDAKFGANPAHDRSMIRPLNAQMAERAAKHRMTEEQRRAEEQAYDSCVAWLDDEIGRLLGELERRGALGNTVVVVTSDHGELFGEHDLFSHGNCLYLPLLHVPLVVAHGPVASAGARIAEPVSLRDVPATLLDLVGAPPGALPGTSLAPLLRGDGARPAPSSVLAEVLPAPNQQADYPSARGPMHSLVEDRHHLIRNGDGVPELFDVLADPAESRDLAAEERSAQALAALRVAIEALVGPLPPGPR